GHRMPKEGRTLGEELLEPTRIYTRINRSLFSRYSIQDAAHITGGGIPGNLPRILPEGRPAWIDRQAWEVPPIFGLIRSIGRVSSDEMDQTFNHGLGIILVVGERDLDGVTRLLRKMGERYFVIGEIRKGRRGVTFN